MILSCWLARFYTRNKQGWNPFANPNYISWKNYISLFCCFWNCSWKQNLLRESAPMPLGLDYLTVLDLFFIYNICMLCNLHIGTIYLIHTKYLIQYLIRFVISHVLTELMKSILCAWDDRDSNYALILDVYCDSVTLESDYLVLRGWKQE